jgi:hypothetical protein
MKWIFSQRSEKNNSQFLFREVWGNVETESQETDFEGELAGLKTDVANISVESLTYPDIFPGEKHPYWEKDNYDYFKILQNEKGRKGEFSAEERKNRTERLIVDEKTVELFRDEGTTFYVVKKGDTINGIRSRLAQIPEFSYLEESFYAHPAANEKGEDISAYTRNISAFNILPRHIKVGMYIPIPLKIDDRRLSYKQVTNYCYEGICEMKEDSFYKEQVKDIVEEHGEKKLLEIMIAFARSETAANTEQAIGEYSFQRYEGDRGHHEYSFTMFHILMQGPGLRARRRLGLTEGQCYHPKNAAKLFLGYWLEKVCNSKGEFDASKVDPYFKMETLADFKKSGRWYCGRSSYGHKLKTNFEYAEKRLKDVTIPEGKIIVEPEEIFIEPEEIIVEPEEIVVEPEEIIEPEEIVRYSFEELTNYLEQHPNPERNITVSKDELGNVIASINREDPKTHEIKLLEVHIEEIIVSEDVTLNTLARWLSGDGMISGTVLELLQSLNPEAAKDGIRPERTQVLDEGQILRVPGNMIAVPDGKLSDFVKVWYPGRKSEIAIDFVKRLNGKDPADEIIRVGETILIPGLQSPSGKAKQEVEIKKQEEAKESAIDKESTFYRVGQGNILNSAIKNAHWDIRQEMDQPIFKSDGELDDAATRVQKYINDIYKKSTYYATDRVCVGKDKYGPYLRFQRGKHTSKKLRVK